MTSWKTTDGRTCDHCGEVLSHHHNQIECPGEDSVLTAPDGRRFRIVRTAVSPDPADKFWGIGQETGPIRSKP